MLRSRVHVVRQATHSPNDHITKSFNIELPQTIMSCRANQTIQMAFLDSYSTQGSELLK